MSDVKRSAHHGDGAETLAQRARASTSLLVIAKHAPLFALLCLPPALWGMIDRAWGLVIALLVPSVLSVALYFAVSRHDLPDDLRRVEAMAAIALVFLISAIITTPAFIAVGMPPVAAFFEAMSGITTTGLSVAAEPDSWPFAAHFLRAWLQWCGGLVIATAVLALLLPSGVPMRQLGRVGINQGDAISSTRKQAQQLLTAYLVLTVLMTVLTALTIPDWREAFVLTLTAISTAGFSPRSDSLASYSAFAQGVVIFTCILGAISLLTFVLIVQGKPREAWELGSIRRVLIAIVVAVTLYTLALLLLSPWEANEIYGSVLNLISGLTTAGFSTGPLPEVGPALVVLLVAMAAGGDFGSTAGGLKLARVAVMFHTISGALRAPRLPEGAFAPMRHKGKPVQGDTLVSILALLCLYVMTALLIWIHFLARGHPALAALVDTISALSTVGLSTGVVGAHLSNDLMLSLSFAMWLGRLEFVAVLVLLIPRTWLRGS